MDELRLHCKAIDFEVDLEEKRLQEKFLRRSAEEDWSMPGSRPWGVKDATSNKCIASSNKSLIRSNKKLVVTKRI